MLAAMILAHPPVIPFRPCLAFHHIGSTHVLPYLCAFQGQCTAVPLTTLTLLGSAGLGASEHRQSGRQAGRDEGKKGGGGRSSDRPPLALLQHYPFFVAWADAILLCSIQYTSATWLCTTLLGHIMYSAVLQHDGTLRSTVVVIAERG